MKQPALHTRIRDAIKTVRTKSYPLADLIPLMQEAADTIERLTPKQPRTGPVKFVEIGGRRVGTTQGEPP